MKAIIRGDLDGIVCAALLKTTGLVDTVETVDIKAVLDGKVEVTDNDIICNLPYNPDAYLWFDHHSSETLRTPPIPPDYRGAFNLAPSTAGVVFQYFVPFHPALKKFEGLVRDTDLLDGADLTKEEVLNPSGNILLGLLLDGRTGLGRDESHRAEYKEWKQQMPDLLCTKTTAEILEMPITKKWHKLYLEGQEMGIEALLAYSELQNNVIFSDFRGVQVPPVNRFILYALPEFAAGNVSVQISYGEESVWNEIAVGHSIFNRSSMVDVGDLCAWYGGGGHRSVAVCRPSDEDTEEVLGELIHACTDDTVS